MNELLLACKESTKQKLTMVGGGGKEPHSLGIGFFCIKLASHSQHLTINKVFDHGNFLFSHSIHSHMHAGSFIDISIIIYDSTFSLLALSLVGEVEEPHSSGIESK